MLPWRPRSATRRIIVHSSHLPIETQNHYAAMVARGREMGLLDIGYHFVIERDGSVQNGRPHGDIGSHTPGNNHDSIGVCLAGDVDHTEMQERALGVTCSALMRGPYGPLQIVGHTELQRYRNREKRCPVASFDLGRLRAHLATTIKDLPAMPDATPKPASAGLMPQQQLILDYLQAGRTLTTKVAIVSLGIMSVSSRVAELRALGHKITGEDAMDHFDRRYVKYRLEAEA